MDLQAKMTAQAERRRALNEAGCCHFCENPTPQPERDDNRGMCVPCRRAEDDWHRDCARDA